MRSLFSGFGVGAVSCAVFAALASPAVAATDRLKPVSDEQIASSVLNLEPRERQFDLKGSITDLIQRSASGTVLAADVLFEFGKADVPERTQKIIEAAAKDIPQGAEVTVDGYTDSIGDESSNQKLSEERAEAVKKILADKRSDLKIKVVGHGEADPVADNGTEEKDNPEGRAKNRRVQLSY